MARVMASEATRQRMAEWLRGASDKSARRREATRRPRSERPRMSRGNPRATNHRKPRRAIADDSRPRPS